MATRDNYYSSDSLDKDVRHGRRFFPRSAALPAGLPDNRRPMEQGFSGQSAAQAGRAVKIEGQISNLPTDWAAAAATASMA